MGIFQPLCPDQELLGKVLLGYKYAINIEEFGHVFHRHGLDQIDPEKWYPQQKLMDVFNDLYDSRSGASMDFVSLGMAMADSAALPPGMEQLSIDQVLGMLNEALKKNWRGSDIGYMTAERISTDHLRLTVRVASPDDLMYGSIYAFARRFLPRGTSFSLSYDERLPRRDQGAHETVMHLRLK